MLIYSGIEDEKIRVKDLIAGIKECISDKNSDMNSVSNATIMLGQLKELIRILKTYELATFDHKTELEITSIENKIQSKFRTMITAF